MITNTHMKKTKELTRLLKHFGYFINMGVVWIFISIQLNLKNCGRLYMFLGYSKNQTCDTYHILNVYKRIFLYLNEDTDTDMGLKFQTRKA